MKVLVVGSAGRLGSALVRRFGQGAQVRAVGRGDLDVRDRRAVLALVGAAGPDVIVNATAFNDVDAAEDAPAEALEVNAFAVRHLAEAAGAAGAALVHYGTDFVFDGSGDRPYTEEDRPNPLNTYGCSKLVGEWFAARVPRHYVLRVESLFGGAGGRRRPTSVERVIEAAAAGRPVRVFTDRTISPAHVDDVAGATRALVERGAAAGLYHCVNSGACTFEDLAREAGHLAGVEPRLLPVAQADVPMRARRPLYCALSNARLAAAGVPMPTWQDALARWLGVGRAEAAAR